jgi:hypothetical protein
MTTVARRTKSESGQSVLEFLFMLPVLFGLALLMLKINTAIQISINNQQYARAQTLWLAFNSSVYPRIELREGELVSGGFNQMLIGVSENSAPNDDSPYVPKAPVQSISRRKPASGLSGLGSDGKQEEPSERSMVRVRNTVTLCTQLNVLGGSGKTVPVLPLGGGPNFKATGPGNLNENSKFDFCGSPLGYL